jgi:hypothetical protein
MTRILCPTATAARLAPRRLRKRRNCSRRRGLGAGSGMCRDAPVLSLHTDELDGSARSGACRRSPCSLDTSRPRTLDGRHRESGRDPARLPHLTDAACADSPRDLFQAEQLLFHRA